MKEGRNLEFKSEVTNTFLKTVSAFANYDGGEIRFGVDDNGNVCGLQNIESQCLDIENKINDSLNPVPDYTIRLKDNIISVSVKEGKDKPYLYKGKAYKRHDTASVEVDRTELNRLTLAGMGKYFDQLAAGKQDLKFTVLEEDLKKKTGIGNISTDILKTLNFFSDEGEYNNAAELLADENTFSGIDIARFGESNDIILDREPLFGKSILLQYEEALKSFRRYYVIDKIEGRERIKQELIPEKAIRESIANALVHRTWDVKANIRISMYADRIEVYSPGGLPFGVSEEEYLRGYVSVLRNPILANVFFRLGFVETFGTGVRRILEAYKGCDIEPKFLVSHNAVVVVLPVTGKTFILTEEEKGILQYFAVYAQMSSTELMQVSGFNKAKTVRILNSLIRKRRIYKQGFGRGTRYFLRHN